MAAVVGRRRAVAPQQRHRGAAPRAASCTAWARATTCWCRTSPSPPPSTPSGYVGATPVLIDSDAGHLEPVARACWPRSSPPGGPTRPRRPSSSISTARRRTTTPSRRCWPSTACCTSPTPPRASAPPTTGGRPASYGASAALSFNGNKIITTTGGGMLVTDDAAVADRVRHLATQAREPVPHYEHVEVGYNYRLSNLLAAFGRAQLADLDRRVRATARDLRSLRRRRSATCPGVGVHARGARRARSNRWLTCITIDASVAGLHARWTSASTSRRSTSRPGPPGSRCTCSRCSGTARPGSTARPPGCSSTGLCLPSGSRLTARRPGSGHRRPILRAASEARRVKVVVTGGAGFIGANLCRRCCSPTASTRWSRSTTSPPGSPPTSTASTPRSSTATSAIPTCSTPCCPAPRRSCTSAPGRRCRGRSRIRWPPTTPTPPARSQVLEGVRRHGVRARRRGVVLVGLRRQPRRCPSTRTSRRCRCRPTRCRSWPPRPTRSPHAASFGFGALAFRFFNVFGPLQAAGHAYAAVVPAFVAAALAGRAGHRARRRRADPRLHLRRVGVRGARRGRARSASPATGR